MKNIFGLVIFLLLAFPVFAEEGAFLTNQNSVKTTQFETSDEIYIEGVCLPANQEPGKIYIMSDKTWQTGDKLFDVSAGIETFTNSSDGRIPRTEIWNKPPSQGTYDVVIDTNNDRILQEYEKQCVIGVTGTGFRVGNPAPAPPPSSPPAPTPPPSASVPSPEPSTEPLIVFSLNDYVKLTGLSNIRKSPGGILIGTQDKGTVGVVVGGPVKASLSGNNYWFWNINFENDPDGWVTGSMLKSAPAPAPLKEVVKEENVSGLSATTTATTTPEETSQNETTTDKILAQISATDKNSGLKPFTDSIIIGIAIFLGLIVGSTIIADVLKRKN